MNHAFESRGRLAGNAARSLSVRLVLAVLLTVAAMPASAATTLSLLTWHRYFDPEVVAEFELEHDARIVFEYFESDELRDQRLAARGGSEQDVIVVNSAQMHRYAQRGWIERLDAFDIPNRARIDPRWADAFPSAERFGVAYFWGTLGIAWREDLWPQGFDSWSQLLAPDPSLAGKIIMTSQARELVGIALKADGQSANEGDRRQIDAAGALLEAQAPSVHAYGYTNMDQTSALVTGEAVAGFMYNGTVLVLQEHEPAIRYAVPREGGLMWLDYLAISSKSRNKTLAAAFVDFLNRPEIAARQARYLKFATANRDAEQFLDEDFLTDERIYPSPEVLDSSEFLRPLPPRSRKRVNAIGAALFYR